MIRRAWVGVKGVEGIGTMGLRLSEKSDYFRRTDVTWAAYLLLGYFGYLQAALGPIMPFLRGDLRLSCSAAGLHFSAFAAGMIAAGLAGNRVTQLVGRRIVFWGGALGMAAGACLVIVGRQAALTVAGAGVMGVFGTLLLVTIQAVLSDEHGSQRTRALTESNVAASLASGLAALVVGLGAGAGLGWRAALLVPIGFLSLAIVRFRHAPLPVSATASISSSGGTAERAPLPALFWIYWAVVVLSVAAEWCMTFWGADYLEHVVALNAGVAATVMGVYLFGTVAARVVGSRLTGTTTSEALLVAAIGVALAGFSLFWLAPRGPLTFAGLFVTGLGIANLFPLGLATGLGIAPRRSDLASARISLGAGLAIFVAPLTLGGLADHVGIRAAYGVVPLLLCGAGALALGAIVSGRRLTRQSSADVRQVQRRARGARL